MNTIGFTLAMLSSHCMFAALYYVNFKYNFKKGFKWLGIGLLFLAIAFVIALI